MGWLSDLIEGLVPGAIEDVFKTPLPQITPPDISFKPFTVSGPTGGITAGPGGTTYTLSPEQQAMQNQLFGGAGQFFTQAAVQRLNVRLTFLTVCWQHSLLNNNVRGWP